jgi:hypothetical protein
VFVVKGVVPQTSVEDADHPVRQGTEGLVVACAAGPLVVVEPLWRRVSGRNRLRLPGERLSGGVSRTLPAAALHELSANLRSSSRRLWLTRDSGLS